jgi:hypothetical protein
MHPAGVPNGVDDAALIRAARIVGYTLTSTPTGSCTAAYGGRIGTVAEPTVIPVRYVTGSEKPDASGGASRGMP